MKDLIEALTIFARYQPECYAPTACEHDVLYVMDVSREAVSAEDKAELERLGFLWFEEEECWGSFRFGSA